MTKHFCDRCGAELKEKEIVRKVSRLVDVDGKKIDVTIAFNKHDGKDSPDLCSPCIRKVAELACDVEGLDHHPAAARAEPGPGIDARLEDLAIEYDAPVTLIVYPAAHGPDIKINSISGPEFTGATIADALDKAEKAAKEGR